MFLFRVHWQQRTRKSSAKEEPFRKSGPCMQYVNRHISSPDTVKLKAKTCPCWFCLCIEMPLACRIHICDAFFCEYFFTHIGYWKIFVLVQCRGHILLWKWRSVRGWPVNQKVHVSADLIKCRAPAKGYLGTYVISYNLWHNHPFDLVWFYAHTICIFIRTASEFILFREVNKNQKITPQSREKLQLFLLIWWFWALFCGPITYEL